MDVNIIWDNEDTETLETLNTIFNLQEVKTMLLNGQLQNISNNTMVIVQYDNAGYTVYKNKTLKTVIACIYTQKAKHGILIYDENTTIKQVKKLFKQYKSVNN